jgi:hypothetical protein
MIVADRQGVVQLAGVGILNKVEGGVCSCWFYKAIVDVRLMNLEKQTSSQRYMSRVDIHSLL